MGRAIVLRRWFFLPVAVAAAVIGLWSSTGENAAQQAANLPRGDAVAGPIGDAQRQAVARQVGAAFDQAVEEHAAATQALAWLKPGEGAVYQSFAEPVPQHHPFRYWSLGRLQPMLLESPTLENLVKKLTAAGGKDEIADYLHFAQRYLNHGKPQYRAVACEFAGHFPLQVIDAGMLPSLGRRLSDSATAFDGATFGAAQVYT